MSTKTTPAPLTHRGGCTGPRDLDLTDHPAGITTRHCVDCGAHDAITPSGDVLPEPTATGALANAHDDHDVTFERASRPRRGANWPAHADEVQA